MAKETNKSIWVQNVMYYFMRLCLLPFKTDRQISTILSGILNAVGKKVHGIIFYTQRPLVSEDINYTPLNKTPNKDLAIIIQGPLKAEDDFTMETVKIYRILFPEALLIVSTWKTENQQILREIEREGALIIQSESPIKNGVGNMNYQRDSTLAGLHKAYELGFQYSIKTRTDQRIYKTDMYAYFKSLLHTFPIDDIWGIGQKGRIIFCQGIFPNSMLIPYHICDFFFFGHTQDLIAYYDCDYSQVEGSFSDFCEMTKREGLTIGEYYCKIAPEAILSTSYLKRHGITVDYNDLENYWKFVSSYMVPVSFDDLNLVWSKYAKLYNESNTKNDYRSPGSALFDTYNQNWSFANWLGVKTGNITMSEEAKRFCNRKNNY